jgi:hypothetical protein
MIGDRRSPSQSALANGLFVEIVVDRQGRIIDGRVGRPSKKTQICAISDAQAAKLLNVSARSVETARRSSARRFRKSSRR